MSFFPCKKKTCKFYFKILLCLLFLFIYFAVFLQESINATKLKQQTTIKQQHQKRSTGLGGAGSFTRPGAPYNGRNKPPEGPVEDGGAERRQIGGGRNKTLVTKAGDVPHSMPAVTTPHSVNSLYEYSDELNAALEKEFAARNSLLVQQCANLQLTNAFKPNAWEFFISPGHSLAYCPVFKAASTIWLYYFNVLGGYNADFLQRTQMPPLELARKKFPRPTPEELEDVLATSTSFLVVREPFERLVSAYRDKFEGSRNKYYKQLGEKIVKRFRAKGNGTSVVKHPKGPTFEEFINYVIHRHNSSGVAKMDEHWAPIYSFCTPCTINFTLIVKTDTLGRDSEYIWRQSLIESLLFDKLPGNAKLRALSNRAKTDTKSIKFKYFSKLSALSILDNLLNIYKPDFELFGYNSTVYYEVLTNQSRMTSRGDD